MIRRILVFSDTHRCIDRMLEVTRHYLPDLDRVIHLGDNALDAEELSSVFQTLPVVSVPGNCDFSKAPGNVQFTLNGISFLVTHGHLHSVKRDIAVLASRAVAAHADVALFGHTHKPCHEMRNGVLLFNPGSISEPRACYRPSYGVLTIENGAISAKHEFWED